MFIIVYLYPKHHFMGINALLYSLLLGLFLNILQLLLLKPKINIKYAYIIYLKIYIN